jgi:hypothetical protein
VAASFLRHPDLWLHWAIEMRALLQHRGTNFVVYRIKRHKNGAIGWFAPPISLIAEFGEVVPKDAHFW